MLQYLISSGYLKFPTLTYNNDKWTTLVNIYIYIHADDTTTIYIDGTATTPSGIGNSNRCISTVRVQNLLVRLHDEEYQ